MQVARGDSRVQASPSEPQVDSLPSRASLLLRLGRSASFGAADGPHRSAAAAAAEVGVAAIGLEPRYTHARRSAERRVGEECVSPGRTRGSPYINKKNKTHE